jgi:hypothetical protein
MLVAVEHLKDEATTVEGPALAGLAALCRRAAASSEAGSDVAAKACQLETEWKSLAQPGIRPASPLAEERALDAESAALASRMVNFLSRELPNLSALAPPWAG